MEKRQQKIDNIISLLKILRRNSLNADFNMGITMAQGHILLMIKHNNGQIQASELANKFDVTPGAISQFLYNLEEKKLINKTTDKNDKRKTIISLSNKGRGCLKKFKTALDKKMQNVFMDLTDDEINQLENIVAKIALINKKDDK